MTWMKSLLRPADLMTTKNGAAENLELNLSESSLQDVDKVLLKLRFCVIAITCIEIRNFLKKQHDVIAFSSVRLIEFVQFILLMNT